MPTSVFVTMSTKQFLRFITLSILFVYVCSDRITFQNVTLWREGEKLGTIVNGKKLNEYLPKKPVTSVRVTGYIPTLYENSVTDVKNVRYLTFQYNQIGEIQSGAFKNLNGLEVLDIEESNFTIITKDTFENLKIETLRLNYNGLVEIEGGAFKNLPKLKTLSIAYNSELEKLHDGVFDDLNVETLLLGHNSLQTFPQNIFQKLPNLKNLFLEGNKIKILQTEMFEDLPLERLDLSLNLISTIPGNFFTTMRNMEEIYLSHNQLAVIPSGVFTNNQNLKIVDLSSNGLSSIASDAFDNMSKLKAVDFASNNLTKIDNKWFHNSPNIVKLNFIQNSIATIPNEAFRNAYNNKPLKINLAKNKIREVLPDAFKGVKKISVLVLNFNEIEIWQDVFLEDVDEITILDLFGNKIKCPVGDFDKVFKANFTQLVANPLGRDCSKRIDQWEKKPNRNVIVEEMRRLFYSFDNY